MKDLSTLTRDELRNLLIMAQDEWKKYTNCRDEIEWCEKSIEEEKKNKDFGDKNGNYSWFFLFFCVGGGIFVFIMNKKDFERGLWVFLSSIIIFPMCILYCRKKSKTAQRKITEYIAQLSNLDKKEEKAVKGFDKVWNIPDEYCYDYAFTKMLQYIDSFKAHSWKEVTTLYDRHVHEKTVEYNTRITASEARKQIEIAQQIRNLARSAATGI
jgi:hypothetical protein